MLGDQLLIDTKTLRKCCSIYNPFENLARNVERAVNSKLFSSCLNYVIESKRHLQAILSIDVKKSEKGLFLFYNKINLNLLWRGTRHAAYDCYILNTVRK